MEEKNEPQKGTQPKEGEDFRDADGILICGTCKKPKERRFPSGGIFKEPRVVPVMCACQMAEEEKRKKAEAMREHRRKTDALRAACFPSFGRYAFSTFADDDGRNPKQTTICKAFAATFDVSDPTGLVLYGDCGTGKSFHAACIANAIIENGHTCLVTDIKQVVNLMESSFEKRMEHLGRILKPELLILEDLGAQRSTEYVMEYVYDVIDGRYKAGKPMVITTNFDFRHRIMAASESDPWRRVFDRIVECGYPVKYEGESRRRVIGSVRRENFRKKLGIEGIES